VSSLVPGPVELVPGPVEPESDEPSVVITPVELSTAVVMDAVVGPLVSSMVPVEPSSPVWPPGLAGQAASSSTKVQGTSERGNVREIMTAPKGREGAGRRAHARRDEPHQSVATSFGRRRYSGGGQA
jgi:hypothetical protein